MGIQAPTRQISMCWWLSAVSVLTAAQERFSIVTPFGGPSSSGMLTLHCPPDQIAALASFLRSNGAEAVAVAGLDYVFARENPLYAKLAAGLG
jgi:ATP phosphoribosyltransferase